MTRLATALILLLALLASAIAPAAVHAQDLDRVAYLLNIVGDNDDFVTSNATCRVLTASTNTDATIYSDPALSTTASNPLTVSSAGECKFYISGSITSVDVLVLGNGGNYKGSRARVQGLTRTSSKLVYLQRNVAERIVAVPFSRSISSAQTTSAYTIPKGALIKDVIVETQTAVAASTIDVSFAGAANNRILCSVATTATAQGFANCASTSALMSASNAITYNTQDHATTGYLWVKYIETAVGP